MTVVTELLAILTVPWVKLSRVMFFKITADLVKIDSLARQTPLSSSQNKCSLYKIRHGLKLLSLLTGRRLVTKNLFAKDTILYGITCTIIKSLFHKHSLPANPHNEFAVHGSDKGFSDSWLHSVEILFTDHVVLYHTKGLCCLLSDASHITGRRRKGKGLVGPFRYNYYCGCTKDPVLIWNPAFIFVIMLFPPGH